MSQTQESKTRYKKSSREHFKHGIPSPCSPVGLQDPRIGIIKSPTYKYQHRGKNKGDTECHPTPTEEQFKKKKSKKIQEQ